MEIYSVGHSNQGIDSFLDTLTAHGITLIADVRRYPMSRRHPHFNKQRLSEALRARGIDYEHFVELGGRRRPRPDSRNTAWNNEQFRGYADYMETREFEEAIAQVLARASEQRVALMCAELLWWECHRSLIADYLKVRGHEVTHIVSARKTEAHPYTSAASIVDGRLSYDSLL